jgi:hypothetical protein
VFTPPRQGPNHQEPSANPRQVPQPPVLSEDVLSLRPRQVSLFFSTQPAGLSRAVFGAAGTSELSHEADPINCSYEIGRCTTLVELCFRREYRRDNATGLEPLYWTFGTLLVAQLGWLFRNIQGRATQPQGCQMLSWLVLCQLQLGWLLVYYPQTHKRTNKVALIYVC